MLLLLGKYSRTRFLLERYKNQIKESLIELNNGDINLFFMVWNNDSNNWVIEKEITKYGYIYQNGQCKNGSTISFDGSDVIVDAHGKDTCYVYFKEINKDISLKIYALPSDYDLNNIVGMEFYSVNEIPDSSYSFVSCTCDENASCDLINSRPKHFTIESEGISTCKAIFVKNN